MCTLLCAFLHSDHLSYLAKAAFPEHLVQSEVVDGEFGLVIFLWNGVQRLFWRHLADRPADFPWPLPRNALIICNKEQVRKHQRDQVYDAASMSDGKEDFRGCVPLLAGTAEAGEAVTCPDGARTTPGWATLTGPSRPMMSESLVLLA